MSSWFSSVSGVMDSLFNKIAPGAQQQIVNPELITVTDINHAGFNQDFT